MLAMAPLLSGFALPSSSMAGFRTSAQPLAIPVAATSAHAATDFARSPRRPTVPGVPGAATMGVLGGAVAAVLGMSAVTGAHRGRRRSFVPRRGRRSLTPDKLLNILRSDRMTEEKHVKTAEEWRLPNSRQAALMLQEARMRNREEGLDTIRPSLARRDARLPLVVKYHKPKGVMTTFAGKNNDQVEDLRAVVSAAGDRWELDLYHPMGRLPTNATGLFLWSRSGILTKELQNPRRGIVVDQEVDIIGVPNEEELRKQLREGASIGTVGFQQRVCADLKSVKVMPESSLQEPRSCLRILTMGSKAILKPLLKKFGYRVIAMRRVGHGIFSLGDLKEGEFAAATEEEEEWACQMAGLPASEFPPGRLPPPTPMDAEGEQEEAEEILVDVTYSDRD
mmetsp:Transcript_36278/g.91355  ORF Transcript_36278/g.91355 Transcript_36278/m.91355 type:complete len:394 (+) Transcript_36278:70-1251(+)